VPTMSCGRRLTRYAPLRMAPSCICETPLRLLRMLPASLMVSGSLNRFGGAKSSPVNVPDLRSKCLSGRLAWMVRRGGYGITYGLGIEASSSKALAVGTKDGTAGEYGRRSPRGLSERPATRSR
jgi:hypothetical protein